MYVPEFMPFADIRDMVTIFLRLGADRYGVVFSDIIGQQTWHLHSWSSQAKRYNDYILGDHRLTYIVPIHSVYMLYLY